MNLMSKKTPIVAAALAALSVAGLARADVAEQIPAEALLFVKVNDLRNTSDRFARLAQDFGVAAFAEELTDPLTNLKRDAGFEAGLDEAGDAAFYLLTADENIDDDLVVLVPVSDYDAFLGNFDGNEAAAEAVIVDEAADADIAEAAEQVEEEVEEVVLPDGVTRHVGKSGQTFYIVQRGDHAAVAQSVDPLKSEPGEGLSVADQSATAVDEQDIVLYANFLELGPILTAELDKTEEDAKSDLLEELEEEEATTGLGPVAEAAATQGFMVVRSFLRDAEAATVGLTLDPDAIGVQVIADFAEDSYLGQNLGAIGGTDASLLAGLPDVGAYLVFGGSTGDLKPVVSDVLDPVIEAARGIDGEGSEKATELADLLEQARDLYGDAEGASFGVLAPAGDFGAEPLLQSITVMRGDGEALKQGIIGATQGQQDLMQLFAGEIAEQGGEVPAVQIEQDAKEVSGVSFTKLTTDLPPGPATMIYGPEGAVTMIGSFDGGVVQVAGLSDEKIAKVIEAAQGGLDPIAGKDNVAETAELLPTDRIAVFYFAADELVKSLGDVAQTFGQPVQVQLPPDLPPLGSTVVSSDGALKIDVVLPSDTVAAIIAQGMQTYMQFQGGGPGGGL